MVSVFPEDLLQRTERLLANARAKSVKLATAESCTGGLLAALLTEIPGASDVVERGFVTYSNQAKTEMLGVSAKLLLAHGAVSREVARAMAEGALARSGAAVAVAVTGVAGPGGGSAAKPVGLVEFACAVRDRRTLLHTERFGDLGRSPIRLVAVGTGLALFERALSEAS